LWSDSEVWPKDGEIDFPEGNLERTIAAFMHKQNGTSGSDQDASSNVIYASWHTAILEWAPDHTRFILDGQVIRDSMSRIPNTLMHLVLQTETALDGKPSITVSGNVQIDWVALYAYAPVLHSITLITPTLYCLGSCPTESFMPIAMNIPSLTSTTGVVTPTMSSETGTATATLNLVI
jgi:hypothetical protein